ncbi:MAG TPA: hypothetical protein VLL82_13630 [Mycobacterium sp.]|nr:hypothetical protein [Mycobacterium sp.]
MSHDQILKKMIAGALLSGGVAVAGLGLATGTAQPTIGTDHISGAQGKP